MFAGVLIILAVLLIAAATLSAGDDKGTDSSGQGIREASNDRVAIELQEVRAADSPADAPMDIEDGPADGKHFVFVNVSVTNKGPGPQQYGPEMFHLLVGEMSVDGLTHVTPAIERTSNGTMAEGPENPVVQPGDTVGFWVPFEVEDGAELQRLVFYQNGDEAISLPL